MPVFRPYFLLPACLALAAHAHAAAPNMREGLWEITMKVEMAGMPQQMPPQTLQHCVTKQDLENPQKMAMGPGSKDSKCEVTDHRMQGNTATWKMACRGEHPMTGSGIVTYSGTSYSGTNRMTMQQGGKTMDVTMSYTGRHLGPCAK